MKIYQIRLHKALSDYIKEQKIELTNPEIARNITSFGVKIGDELVFNRQHWILIDQKIDITHWPKREASEIDKTQIWLETQEFLLINKPFGVVCQSGNGHKLDNLEFWLNEAKLNQKTLKNQENQQANSNPNLILNPNLNSNNSINSILSKAPEFLTSNPTNNQPNNELNLPFFSVHRLDKNTQGLILFAKGPENLEKLQKEFRQRRVVKKYFAVLDGIMEQNWFVSNWQTRDKNNAIIQKFFWSEVAAKNYDQNAKNAASIIIPKVICEQKNQTLVQIQILTGRMHQIRLQCQNLGFPLISDAIYGDVKNLEMKFFNSKLGDFFASSPFFNLNSLSSTNNSQNFSKNEIQNNLQNQSENQLQNLEESEIYQNFDNWDNSSIQIKQGRLEKLTQNLNPREKHFFAQKEKERLNLKVRFIDKKSKNVPNKIPTKFSKNNPISSSNLNNSQTTNSRNFANFNSTNSNSANLSNSTANSTETKLEGFYNFFGSKVVKNTNLKEFENLKKQIFGEREYCLLANFLGIKINDFYLESSIFDLENYLENL